MLNEKLKEWINREKEDGGRECRSIIDVSFSEILVMFLWLFLPSVLGGRPVGQGPQVEGNDQ